MDTVTISKIVAILVTLVVCFGVPVFGWFFLCKRFGKGTASAIIAGSLGFFIPQILIRIPILQYSSKLAPVQAFIQSDFLIYGLLLAFTAGLFETFGRLVIFKTFLKNRITYQSSVSAGFGHGAIEAVFLIGFAYVNNLIFAIMINNGTIFDSLAKSGMTSAKISELVSALTKTPATLFYVAGFERIFTMLFHIAISVLLAYGISKGKTTRYFVLCLALHTALDFIAVAAQHFEANVYMIEGVVAIFGIVGIVFVKRIKKYFSHVEMVEDEADIAVSEGN